jgi:hypothetical protein
MVVSIDPFDVIAEMVMRFAAQKRILRQNFIGGRWGRCRRCRLRLRPYLPDRPPCSG